MIANERVLDEVATILAKSRLKQTSREQAELEIDQILRQIPFHVAVVYCVGRKSAASKYIAKYYQQKDLGSE